MHHQLGQLEAWMGQEGGQDCQGGGVGDGQEQTQLAGWQAELGLMGRKEEDKSSYTHRGTSGARGCPVM